LSLDEHAVAMSELKRDLNMQRQLCTYALHSSIISCSSIIALKSARGLVYAKEVELSDGMVLSPA
jgi:hypothetical protein